MSLRALLVAAVVVSVVVSASAAPSDGFVIEDAAQWEEFSNPGNAEGKISDDLWKQASNSDPTTLFNQNGEENPLEELIKINKNKTKNVVGCLPVDGSKNYKVDVTWPSGVVPFLIPDYFTVQQKKMLADAMSYLSQRTCIRFIERVKAVDDDYVVFQADKDGGCWSQVGKLGGEQKVNLQEGNMTSCWKMGIIVHQLMHVLGFLHEHTRVDRDEYIKIEFDNIPASCRHMYDVVTEDVKSIGSYDYCSVMHFPSKSSFCSVDSSRAIIKAIKEPIDQNTACMGNRGSPTDADIRKINQAYQCSKIDPANWSLRFVDKKLHPLSPLAVDDKRVFAVSSDQQSVIEFRNCIENNCTVLPHPGPLEGIKQGSNGSRKAIFCLSFVPGSGLFVLTSSGSVFQAQMKSDSWTWIEYKRPSGLLSLSYPGCRVINDSFVVQGKGSNGNRAEFSLRMDNRGQMRWSEIMNTNESNSSGASTNITSTSICLRVGEKQNCYPTGGIFPIGKIRFASDPVVAPKWSKLPGGYYIFVSGIRKSDPSGCIYLLYVNFEWKEDWKKLRCTGDKQSTYHRILPIFQPTRDSIKIYTVDPNSRNLLAGTYPGRRYD